MLGAAAVLPCSEAMSDLSDWPKNECHSEKKGRDRERERLDFRVNEPQRQKGNRK